MAVIPQPAPKGPLVLRQDADGVATLTLNRARQYNALSEAMIEALQDALDGVARDKTVRVVVLAGSGKAFSAGHDLKEMRGTLDQRTYEALFKKCSRMMLTMVRLSQPVIARVHGLATAAGCQLVANCDLAVASTEARFATSGIRVGLFCTVPGVALARNVARKQAFEMLVTGEFVSAEKAAEIGLVNRVVPPNQLDQAVADLAGSIIDKSEAAVAAGKQAFYRQLEMGLESAYMYASEEMARNMMLHDAGEGIDAFIDKRKPVWQNR
ncbi:MAG: enoyl-CoA hydratase [Kiloniellales bacterium]